MVLNIYKEVSYAFFPKNLYSFVVSFSIDRLGFCPIANNEMGWLSANYFYQSGKSVQWCLWP
jgi:hypothetical protein